jgi:hypothetical protein
VVNRLLYSVSLDFRCRLLSGCINVFRCGLLSGCINVQVLVSRSLGCQTKVGDRINGRSRRDTVCLEFRGDIRGWVMTIDFCGWAFSGAYFRVNDDLVLTTALGGFANGVPARNDHRATCGCYADGPIGIVSRVTDAELWAGVASGCISRFIDSRDSVKPVV